MIVKKKFSYKDILYKSKRVTTLGLVVVLGLSLIVSSNADNNSEIPVHDGEVLVDSLAVSEENSDNSQNDESDTSDDFEARRAKLELERNKLIATLDSTINNSTNEGEKNNASEEKQRIMEYMEQELDIESMIISKNLPECFVLITDSSVSVTVDLQEMDNNTVAQICDIVMRETERPASKIVIQSKY
jgi:uncharacterized membrane protein